MSKTNHAININWINMKNIGDLKYGILQASNCEFHPVINLSPNESSITISLLRKFCLY